MTPALFWLAATLALALVYIAPTAVRTARFGMKWNASPRDTDMGDAGVVAGPLARAQTNLFETLPLIIGAVLIAHVAGADAGQTALGAQLFFWSRVAYCRFTLSASPTYGASLSWSASRA